MTSVATKRLKTKGFAFLAAKAEIDELRCVPAILEPSSPISGDSKAIPVGVVKLKRTFNMMGCRFWRVNCPGHPNHESDLSYEGLVRWGIIQ